jgi:hypothetical protein
MNDDKLPESSEKSDQISFAEFLESIPPSRSTNINDIVESVFYSNGPIRGYALRTPEIQLHCSNDACNGMRFFRNAKRNEILLSDKFENIYLTYICSNCRVNEKIFSIAAKKSNDATTGVCYKFGEIPVYGPPTPARLIKLIGPDRDSFLKGRRCENQGLGIGAFVYYRRVVENQKNRILDEIIKVSIKMSASPDKIAILENAKKEIQFSKAMASVREAIPQILLINGHNPLTLLHSALSDGLHDKTDEHCLEIANSVRVVLSELSDRLAQALKDEEELNHALSKLLNVKK